MIVDKLGCDISRRLEYTEVMTEEIRWSQDELVYQVFTGRWQRANILDHSGKVLKRLQGQDWQALKSLGFSWIYLLGLFENKGDILVTQEEGVDLESCQHRTPSIFALSDHTQVSPELGSRDDLISLVELFQDQGFKVMVDFVPNHTGLSHPWIQDHPDYYVYDHQDQIVREFSGDVVKLNYSNPQLRQKMIGVLLENSRFGTNGLRCDMAHLIPVDFWGEAIKRVRQDYPDMVFVAEAYPDSLFDTGNLTELLDAGFDVVYDEPLYRNINNFVKGMGSMDYIKGYIDHIIDRENKSSFLVYPSNHDDSVPGEGKWLNALLTLHLLLPQPALIFNGVLQGKHKRLAHHCFEALTAEESDPNNIEEWLRDLLKIRVENSWQLKSAIALEPQALVLEGNLKRVRSKCVLNFGEQQLSLDNIWDGDFETVVKSFEGEAIPPGEMVLISERSS